MAKSRAWTCAVLTVLLSALPVAGCGSDNANKPAVAAISAPAATGRDALPAADARACVGVEAVIGHITVDTVRWSPDRKPFDPAIARRLTGQSRALAAQANFASDRAIAGAVRSTAIAFDGVARAMTAKDLPRFKKAISRSRDTYAVLKKVCSLQ